MNYHIRKAKKCPTCKRQLAPNPHNFYFSNNTIDIVCKNCRKLFSSISHKKLQFNKLRIFWERQNRSKWYQSLNSNIPGFSNFKEHLTPVPLFTYSFFFFIDKRSHLIAKNVFNHLFTIPYIQKHYNKSFESPFIVSMKNRKNFIYYYNEDSIESSFPLLMDGSTPIGLTNVAQNIRQLSGIRRVFTNAKRCRRCNQLLQTFTYPNLDPMDSYDYALIINEHLERQRSPLKPLCFKKSEGSRDGWAQTCIDCLKPWKEQPPPHTKEDKENLFNIHNIDPESLPPTKPDLPTTDSLDADGISQLAEEYLDSEYFG